MWPQARQPTESWFRTIECEPHRGQIIATTSSPLRLQCSRPATAKVRTKASGLFLELVCETSGGAVFVAIPFRAFPLFVEASVHPDGRAELRILPRVADHPAPDHAIAKMALLCGAPGVIGARDERPLADQSAPSSTSQPGNRLCTPSMPLVRRLDERYYEPARAQAALTEWEAHAETFVVLRIAQGRIPSHGARWRTGRQGPSRRDAVISLASCQGQGWRQASFPGL